MNRAFKQLNIEKKKRILNAAFEEFTEKGYEYASTLVIAKEAGIAKGTLFNYFGTKNKLFNYLVEYAFTIIKKEYFDQIDYEETDFFTRMYKAGQLKWKVYVMYGELMNFVAHLFVHQEKYVLPESLQKTRAALMEEFWTSVFTKNIDFTKFRSDIPIDTILNFIRWTMEGYNAELEQSFKSENLAELDKKRLEPYYEEAYEYFSLLRKIYYKEEYIGGE